MTNNTLSTVAVRMVVSGSIVERRDTHEVLSIIESRLRPASGVGLAVGSVNLDHLHHFRTVSAAPSGRIEWLLLADGMPIALRGQLLTSRPWPRITGADLLPQVLSLAEASGSRVGFFGGSVATHQRLAERISKTHPRLVISGMWAPDSREIESCSGILVSAIRAAHTDILVVSLGKPRQEQWVDRYGHTTGARVFLPCGGAIDFLAGETHRAPVWMQKAGLEWLHRLSREPRRLARRYLIEGPIALLRVRAQLICYPGVYYAGTPLTDQADSPSAAHDASALRPSTA